MFRIDRRYLIVDGYNFINSDAEMARHMATSLATARRHLNGLLSEYVAYSGEIGIVVYDATKGKEIVRKNSSEDNIEVVFTRSGETADSYIEWRVRAILQDKTNSVRVITQDWAEQLVVLGSGGIRLAAREWRREIYQMKQRLQREIAKDSLKGEVKLDDTLDSATLEKLWALVDQPKDK